MQQERVQKQRSQSTQDADVPERPRGPAPEALRAGLDDVIDEIDAILEENMESLANFTQLGGE